MIFEIIRSVMILLSIAIILLVSKKIQKKKRFIILSTIISIIMIATISNFPIENAFYNFDTPEKVFNYTNSGEIKDIVYGKDSCMIVYSTKKNNHNFYFVPKSKNGYKIPNYFNKKNISKYQNSKFFYRVTNVNGTGDYYLFGITSTNKTEYQIINNRNTNIPIIKMDSGINDFTHVVFYDYIDNYETDDYYLIINDEKIMISEKTQSDNSLVTTESR